ncbi:chromosome partitioning protein, ParB family [Eubacterium ruminantium]|nr:chromosome partitioning protein, ParB family [Eubacterium ruminantium]
MRVSEMDAYYNTIYYVSPAELQPFRKVIFHVREDEDMKKLEESIRKNGINTPIFVFWSEYERMEIIDGHRRLHIAEKLEMTQVPIIFKAVNAEQAEILMIDSNLVHRTSIPPSEKGVAYKVMLDAMNHQGFRSELTSTPVEYKSGERSIDELAEMSEDSREQIRRYIRLNDLEKSLVDLVDDKRMGLRPAVELSYLPKNLQQEVYDYYEQNDVTPSHAQTIRFRKMDSEGALNTEALRRILDEGKPNQKPEVEKMIITSPDILQMLKRFESKMAKEMRIITALKLLEEAEERSRNRQAAENSEQAYYSGEEYI